MAYTIIDTETDCIAAYGRKVNPFVNSIVAVGYKHQLESEVRIYWDQFEYQEIKWVDTIVYWNAKFDIALLWKDERFQNFLKRGGKVHCAQTIEYILTGQTVQYGALREAEAKYGVPYRDKKMEEYWKKKISTFDIPKEIVTNDLENDIIGLDLIYKKQLEIIEQMGIQSLIESEMNMILATTEMEYNGMLVDQERLKQNMLIEKAELARDIQVLDELCAKWWSV